ncbi:MAG: pentapeptide repeat-containing protein, partial [Moorea sp. SIO3C2]|nr:pentapeptide repeat-containing protein [Moorena sp. SIO3C2]
MIVEAIVLAMNKAVLPDNNNGVIVGIFGIVATTVFVTNVTAPPIAKDAFNIEGAEPGAGALIFANIIMLTIMLLGAYIAWRALKGDQKNRWIRSCAIAFASIRGTSFQGANLTNANFTGTTLKSTDFREAILTRTNFKKTKKLDLARAGTTYLQNSQVRQLLITGEGQNKNFDRLDLRYLNLQGAKLENASFIDADFYQANLQGANLSRAILVNTKFDRADLRSANLTGSCIQNWDITKTTKLDGIACDYVYLEWVKEDNWLNGDKRDQMPPRGKFIEGGFVNF